MSYLVVEHGRSTANGSAEMKEYEYKTQMQAAQMAEPITKFGVCGGENPFGGVRGWIAELEEVADGDFR